MADTNSYSGDEYSDEDEVGEELDPRVQVSLHFVLCTSASSLKSTKFMLYIQLFQDELEKLNVAANSINHLEAELDVSMNTNCG